MTAYYVSPTGLDSNDGKSWAGAWLTLSHAVGTALAVGDVVYIDKNFSTAAASALTFASTQVAYVSADSSQGTPTGAAGAVIAATGNIAPAGYQNYYEGLTFAMSGTGTFFMRGYGHRFKNCTINPSAGSSSASALQLGNAFDGAQFDFDDCNINFSTVNQMLYACPGRLSIRGGAISSSVTLTNLVGNMNYAGAEIILDSVDLTGLSVNNLVAVSNYQTKITFYRCKLNAAFAGVIAQQRAAVTGVEVYLIECDIAGSGPSYRYEHDTFFGETRAKTSVYRTGGATVNNFPVSWETTVRNAFWPSGSFSPDIALYSEAVSGTLTIEFLASVANLTVADVWLELSYLGDAVSMKGTAVSSEPSSYTVKSTPLTTSAASWNSIPSGFTAYKISVPISPKQAGVINGRMRFAKVMTLNIDPMFTVT